YPAYNGSPGSLNDFGLIWLNSPVTNVVPAARSLNNDIGRVGTTVGFGWTGTGLTGYSDFSNVKRGATNFIDANGAAIGYTNQTELIAVSDFDDPGNADGRNSFNGSSEPTDLEGCTASGDAGGGTFIDVLGRTYLAGIQYAGGGQFDVWDSSYSDY